MVQFLKVSMVLNSLGSLMAVSYVKQAWWKTSKLFIGGWGGLNPVKKLCSTGKKQRDIENETIITKMWKIGRKIERIIKSKEKKKAKNN